VNANELDARSRDADHRRRMPQVARTVLEHARTSRGTLVNAGVYRFSVAHFLGALVIMFIALPFLEAMDAHPAIQAALFSVVLGSAVLAVGGRHRRMVWATALVGPAIVGRWFEQLYPALVPAAVTTGAGVAFIVFIVAQLLMFILRAKRVDAEVLCAGVAAYLMLALLWASGYMLVWNLSPKAFAVTSGEAFSSGGNAFTAVYFSVITLATVGYGDIVPATAAARTLAMLEAMTGTIYIAVIISRLVALYTMSPPREEKTGS
jgi:hypothetical protein